MRELPSEEVHVFVVRIPPVAPSEATLSPEERRRAIAFHREEDRRRFVASRAALRGILAVYAGVAPAEIAFSTRCPRCGDARHGKPSLARPAGSDIRFNASASGEVALVAVARGCEVGVDVEHVREDVAYDEVAARFFRPEERHGLDAERFHEIWTLKEARLKLSGLGLAGDLAADEDPATWAVLLDLPRGHVGALAAEHPRRVLVHPWS